MAQILRDSGSVDFGAAPQVNVSQTSAPFARPDYAKFQGTEGRLNTAVNPQQPGIMDQLISAIAPVATKWADGKLKQSQLDAYLSGQAAAASGQAREEVQGNIMTKDWAQAGWSDTKARLTLADAVAQTQLDIQSKLREQDPSKMQDYLQQRRDQLLPLMDGMSPDAKKGFMAQMLMADRQAIAEHTNAYGKYIIGTQAQAVTTSFAVQNDAMNTARANQDTDGYMAATKSALANVYGNIWMNPNMPMATKQQMVGQAAQLALDNGHLGFYEQLRTAKLPGSDATMIDSLPFAEQSKLATGYVEAKKKFAVLNNADYISQLGLYEGKLSNPTSAPVSWADHQAMVEKGVQLGIIDSGKMESLDKLWASSQLKLQQDTRAASYFQSGNTQGLFSLGLGESDGVKSWVKLQGLNGTPMDQVVAKLANIGLTTGQQSAFAEVGTLLKSSVAQLRLGNGQMDQTQVQNLNSVLKILDTTDQKYGNSAATTAFLSSFSPDDAALLTTFRTKLKQTDNVVAAAQDAATQEAQYSKMAPAEKAALGQLSAKENADLVAQLEPKGVFGQFWDKYAPDMFRSQNSVSLDALRADRGGFGNGSGDWRTAWKEDPERVEAAMGPVRIRLLQELNAISAERPFMPKEDRQALAIANVARDTVNTAGGPLVVPRGQTPQQFFGAPATMSPDVIGSALSTMHEAAKGNRMVYSITSSGQVMWQEWGPRDYNNPNPSIVHQGVFDPKTVGAAAQAQLDRRIEEFNNNSGSGTTLKGQDGSAITFNGINTVGIANNVAYNIRQDLIKYEGVRMKPYAGPLVRKDGSTGTIDTVGVGVSKTSPFYPPIEADGTVLPSNLNKSFMLASNDAMNKANEAAVELPPQYRSVDTMRLFTQLAYQHGSVYPNLVKAMQSGNRADAISALQSTTAYKGAHQERRAFYDQLISRIMFNNPQ
jgi:hypothetical protein